MPRICSIDGCETKHKGHGFCEKHLDRFKKYGDPLAGGTPHGEPMRWLKSKVDHAGDECLIWPYSRNKRGYATIGRDGKSYGAYRLMCELAHGEPTADKYEAAHSCGRGHEGCVNPRHLRWASRTENQRDRLKHGTDSRGEKCGKAKLSEDDVREIIRQKGNKTVRQLADIYGVHHSTIWNIQSRNIWTYIEV